MPKRKVTLTKTGFFCWPCNDQVVLQKVLTTVILLQVRHTVKRWKWTGDWNWSQKRDQVEMKGRVREGCFGGRGLLPNIWGDESGSSRKRGWRRCFSPLLLCFFRHMVGKFSISPICPCHGFLAVLFRQFWHSRIKILNILLQFKAWRPGPWNLFWSSNRRFWVHSVLPKKRANFDTFSKQQLLILCTDPPNHLPK